MNSFLQAAARPNQLQYQEFQIKVILRYSDIYSTLGNNQSNGTLVQLTAVATPEIADFELNISFLPTVLFIKHICINVQ